MYKTAAGRLPKSDNQAPPPSSKESGPENAGAFPGASLRKVLVVDDQQDLADLTETLLQLEGLDTVVAYSGQEALQALERHADIDAILTDIMMPGMTGLELAEVVTGRYPHIKIVLTSGYTLPALLADKRTHYLYAAKPYNIATIMKLLRC